MKFVSITFQTKNGQQKRGTRLDTPQKDGFVYVVRGDFTKEVRVRRYIGFHLFALNRQFDTAQNC
jgi:hypothetical protein